MQIHKIPFNAMACGCEIVLATESEQHALAIAQAAVGEVLRIQKKFSRYTADSIVSRINQAAGHAPVQCDEETWSLLEFADTLYRTSDHLFDITAGVLRKIWHFNEPRIPDLRELADTCRLIDWSLVERSDQQIRLPQVGMEVDFGGFGKEYAADRAADVMAANGVQYGYINLGGDISVLGPKPDHTPWMIGIQNPRKRDQLIASIPLSQGSLATSGDYERFFELDGKRYCHILNPFDGQPVQQWRSVSVIAPLTTLAGSCTTIAMLKQQEAIDYLNKTGLNYLAMDQEERIHMKQTQATQ